MRKAISLALINDNKLLVVRKNSSWILPGGKPEEGETDLICLERELSEELPKLKLSPPSCIYYDKFEGITPHKRDLLEDLVYLHISFDRYCDITISGEISKSQFYDYNELKYLQMSDITSKIVKSLKIDHYL